MWERPWPRKAKAKQQSRASPLPLGERFLQLGDGLLPLDEGLLQRLSRHGLAWVYADERGWMKGGLKWRAVRRLHWPVHDRAHHVGAGLPAKELIAAKAAPTGG